MYNKLVLENRGEEFAVTFDGKEHIVPAWKFEAEETLGNFIHGQARKWKLDVNKISTPEAPKVTKIEPVISEVVESVRESKSEKSEVKTETKIEEKKSDPKGFGYKL